VHLTDSQQKTGKDMNKRGKEKMEDETAPVLPTPDGIACEGCRHGVQQVQSLGWGLETWWYCRLLHGWVWAGDPEGGYPVNCSAWEGAGE
jgi:hypothetical protein